MATHYRPIHKLFGVMLRNYFTTCFLIFLCVGAFGQGWSPILPGKTQLFKGFEASTFDSVLWGFRSTFSHVQGQDSIFLFNRIFRQIPSNYQPNPCPNVNNYASGQFFFNRENVAGDGMIQKPDGEYLFWGPPADTFRIETQIPLGEKWPFHSATTDSAWIQQKYSAILFSVPDSVMEIQISNGDYILLSKSFGFLDWSYFYPVFSVNLIDTISRGKLLGIKELGVGRPLPDFYQIYQFDANDHFRFHISACPGGGFGCQDTYQFIKIVSGGISGSGFSYQAEKNSVSYTPIPPNTLIQFIPLTPYTLNISYSLQFEILPGEGYVNPQTETWVMSPA